MRDYLDSLKDAMEKWYSYYDSGATRGRTVMDMTFLGMLYTRTNDIYSIKQQLLYK